MKKRGTDIKKAIKHITDSLFDYFLFNLHHFLMSDTKDG